jgi:hypothetical protein
METDPWDEMKPTGNIRIGNMAGGRILCFGFLFFIGL